MNKIYLSNGMEAEEATYKEMYIEEYNNNPLIQALPSLLDKEEIVRKLYVGYKFKDEEKFLNNSIRLHLIHRMYKVFLPLPKHIEVWNMIDTSIRQGYVARNPFSNEYKKYLNETGKKIINRTFELNSRTSFRTTASCGLIIGFSGMGKTTTVNRVLSNIPQIICHNWYNNQHFNQIQLSWLKLEAPHNASLKALCLQFFMKIDELLGTDNFKRYVSRNLSVDAMLPLMGKVAQNVGLGMLVIDELQHLNRKGVNQVMNFFVTLINSFGVPIIFVGTPASYDFLQNELRMARRITGNGEVIWNNMDNNSEFRLFMNGIWKYQWTKKTVDLTEDIIDLFYEKTQGISDLVVKLFVNTQKKAIMTGTEELCLELISKVADEKFKLMKPMINAIKSGNSYKIQKYEDIRRLEENKVTNNIPIIKKQVNVNGKDISIKKDKEVTNVKIKKSIIKVESLEDEDIRKIVKEAQDNGKNAYEALMENNFIDELSFLEVGDLA